MLVGCDTVHTVRAIFDLCSMPVDNPIQARKRWVKNVDAALQLQLPTVWKIVELFVACLILNVLVLAYLQIADDLLNIWKAVRAISRMRLISECHLFFLRIFASEFTDS